MLKALVCTVLQWVGMQVLLAEMGVPVEEVMAVGDGSNDYQLVKNCGLGVAMANAVPEVQLCRFASLLPNLCTTSTSSCRL